MSLRNSVILSILALTRGNHRLSYRIYQSHQEEISSISSELDLVHLLFSIKSKYNLIDDVFDCIRWVNSQISQVQTTDAPILCFEDDNFPLRLKNNIACYNTIKFPLAIRYIGNIENFKNNRIISISGSYKSEQSKEFSYECAIRFMQYGFTIAGLIFESKDPVLEAAKDFGGNNGFIGICPTFRNGIYEISKDLLQIVNEINGILITPYDAAPHTLEDYAILESGISLGCVATEFNGASSTRFRIDTCKKIGRPVYVLDFKEPLPSANVINGNLFYLSAGLAEPISNATLDRIVCHLLDCR